MLGMEYKQSQGDHTLFIQHSVTGEVTALLVYVDDIIIMGNDMVGLDMLRGCLVKEFKIKELGKLKYFWILRWLILSKESLSLNTNTYLTC